MRISDWSSDVCSSDLVQAGAPFHFRPQRRVRAGAEHPDHPLAAGGIYPPADHEQKAGDGARGERKSVGEGKGGSVSVDLGGRRSSKQKKKTNTHTNDSKRSQQEPKG